MYQRVSGFSALAAGTFVDTDGAVPSDGSLLATRMALEDPLAVQVQIGGCYTPRLPSLLLCWGQQQQGTGVDVIGGQYFSSGNAGFPAD